MKVFLLLALTLLGRHLQAQEANEAEVRKERPRVLCGRVLADARVLYCFSNENYKDDSMKRSFHNSPLQALLAPRERELPWMRMSNPQRALALRGKRDPGLVDECCYKACYLSELLAYC